MNLYFFNWPSNVGGADTKFAHLMVLLQGEYRITVVAEKPEQLAQRNWRAWLEEKGLNCCLYADLPAEERKGWAVSLCNGKFFMSGHAREMKRRGMKIAWSSEMMWHFQRELTYVMMGRVDKLLYVSPVQRAALEPRYRQCLRQDGTETAVIDPDATEGYLGVSRSGTRVSWAMTGNYIDPGYFPFLNRFDGGRDGDPIVIGRLSRPDPKKFPADFPASYEEIGLPGVKFRVMAWSDDLAKQWKRHCFDSRWDLLAAEAEEQITFLHSLDIFYYDLGPQFSESWGRSVVEAMLTGAVPVVPADPRHHLHRLVVHGESGFLCHNREEFLHYTRLLVQDRELRRRLSYGARAWAVERLCHAATHRELWRRAFEG